ncbi:MAG: ABC transporter ATP-binding protein [Bacteroidetes bacterium]|nr:ABC transporter ATP-binding protein [Bacteroidota bacterium]
MYQRSSPFRGQFYLTFLLVLVLAGMSVIRPSQMRDLLDKDLPSGDFHAITWAAIGFVVVLVIESLIQYYQTYQANKMAQSITLDMRAELYKHSLGFRLGFFDKTPVGQMVTRHISDVDGIAEVFSVGLLDIFRDILKLVVITGAMIWVDWKMTLVVVLPIPILLYATRIFQESVKKSFNDVRNEVARINVFIQEHVTGMHIVQMFRQEKREQAKFEEINEKHRDAHIRGVWAYSIFFPVVEVLSALSVSLMLGWAMRGAFDATSSPGVLLQFSTFISMMYRPIRQMADNFNVLQMGMINAERVFEMLDRDESQASLEEKEISMHGAVSFDQVQFAYVEDQWVLKNFNFEVKQGEMIALVGHTGSGKSTIVQLINRLYEPQSGTIKIDGKDVQSWSLDALRNRIAVVPQEVFLFSDSIYNNLTLFDSKITQQQVEEACKKVGIHDFIMQLPGNYAFDVRERGAVLSVGQRQLLAFVRAYLRDPAILILDEATSSIDSESEKLIQNATAIITQGRTSFVVAHRLSTIQEANRILVLDKGEILEEGNHETLMRLNGHYHKMYNLQFDEQY